MAKLTTDNGIGTTTIINEEGSNFLAINNDGALNTDLLYSPTVPFDLTTIEKGYLTAPGAITDLRIDGTTPINFDFNADPSDDIYLQELKILISSDDIQIYPNTFMKVSPGLTNGIKISIKSNGIETEFANIKITEDWFFMPFTDIKLELAAPRDYMMITTKLGKKIILKAGTDDKLRFTIRDNIAGDTYIKFIFKAFVLGLK